MTVPRLSIGFVVTLIVFLICLTALYSHCQTAPNPPGYSLPNAPSPSHSKLERRIFWITNGVFLPTSIVYDAEVTHQGLAHHLCVEGDQQLPRHPSRGQLYAIGAAYGLGEFGIDFILHKAHLHYLDNMGAVVGGIVHFQAGSTWFTHGCY